MTTIVATRRPDEKGVIFAFDSQVTWSGTKLISEPKVFQRGPVTFGGSGTCRDSDILEHLLDVPSFDYKNRANPARWVVCELVPAIQKALDKGHQFKVEDNRGQSESNFVITIPGLLGILTVDMGLIATSEPYVAVGSGSDFALGALYAGSGVEEAVEIAAMLDNHTGGEIKVVEVDW